MIVKFSSWTFWAGTGVEVGVGHLGLDHPELREVAARLGLLGPEGRAEAVDPTE